MPMWCYVPNAPKCFFTPVAKIEQPCIYPSILIFTFRVRDWSIQGLTHIRPVKRISKSRIVAPHTDPADYTNLAAPVLISGYPFGFFHQEGTVALMLKLARVTSVHWDRSSIDV